MKSLKNVLLLSLLSVFIAGMVSISYAGDNKITIGEKITIQSKILDEERTIQVYLPTGYDAAEGRYPVIYLLDGEFHFVHASGIVQFLSSRGMMPPTIVVAINNIDRNRDFTPTAIEKVAVSGGADKFMTFITDELMPYLSENYRTSPFEILVGHSLGGTFATYALLNNPEVFDAYIAISPYLMYDDNMLLAKTETDLKSNYNHSQYFYMTLGDEPKYTEVVEKFVKMVKTASPEGLEFSYTPMTKENHNSIPHLSIYNGLGAIYADWKLPKEKFKEGLASIDNHYSKLSEKYGYEISTPEYTINTLGYGFMGDKEYDKAIQVFKENVNRYSSSANVYDSLGEAYEKSNQNEKAEKNYQKAVQIAEKENHPYLKVFADNLNRIQENLAEK